MTARRKRLLIALALVLGLMLATASAVRALLPGWLRGIGISGGTIISPFIKLGGTLAAPTLDLKPVQAAVSTGAAVVTVGLTLLFRGIYDRITAEKKVCDEALTKARKRIDARQPSRSD